MTAIRRRAKRRTNGPLLLLALLIVSTGCGTRLTHEQLLADARAERGAQPRNRAALSEAQSGIDAANPDAATTSGQAGPGVGAGGTTPGTQPGTDPTASGGGEGSTVAAASCTGNEAHLVIASVGQLSGPAGNGVVDEVKATQAWVAAANTRGGVNCHPIDYLVADDGGDPARHQALVQQMVEQNHAVAFVTPTAALTGRASLAYLTQKRIPVIGGVAGDWAYQSPMYFPHAAGGGSRAGVYATAEWARVHGKSRLAVVTCTESSDCATVNQQYGQFAGEAGLSIVYNGQASALQPDYTSVCQAAQRAGAELFAPVIGPAGLTRLAQSCKRVNYRPLYVVPQVTGQPPMASDPNLTPLGVTMPVLPWTVTSNPGIEEFLNVLEQYAPSVAPGPASVIGWVSAKLFEEATRGLTEPTSAAILEGLWTIQHNDLGGLTVPLTFNRDQNAAPSECWWLAQGENGEWTSPNNGQRNCV